MIFFYGYLALGVAHTLLMMTLAWDWYRLTLEQLERETGEEAPPWTIPIIAVIGALLWPFSVIGSLAYIAMPKK